jgi:hypothetical protein
VFGRAHSWQRRRNKNIDVAFNQFSDNGWESIPFPLRVTVLNGDILRFDVAQFTQTLPEHFGSWIGIGGAGRAPSRHKAYARHFRSRLGRCVNAKRNDHGASRKA